MSFKVSSRERRHNRFRDVVRYSGLRRIQGLSGYFRDQVFSGVDTKGKRLLDIGGGNGLASVWAVMEGEVAAALVVDPYGEGSNFRMLSQFEKMRTEGRLADRLELFKGTLIDSPTPILGFDIALLHNSVNHLDETMTSRLHESEEASKKFKKEFVSIRNALIDGGRLIIADCSSRNIFGDLGLKSPFAPSIDWSAHQTPEVWIGAVEDCGFKHRRTMWTVRREFGRIGRLLLSNKTASYLTTSHFVLEFVAT
jgi:hypothetical protein